MSKLHRKAVKLDYGGTDKIKKPKKLLKNLSTVVATGDFLWIASDELRSVECLKRKGEHYRLHHQVKLDSIFPDLPGSGADEADIESIDIADGRLWVCSSHCVVRRKPARKNKDKAGEMIKLDPDLRLRPSQMLFGSVDLKKLGGSLARSGQTLPFIGTGSLRSLLESNQFLAPFLPLPTKENGLDIEGMVMVRDRAFFGLRGPLINAYAVVVEVAVEDGLRIDNRAYHLHFLDLNGLGIRDLTHVESDLLLLAGPMNRDPGPFRVHRWTPQRDVHVQAPAATILDDWTKGGEQPEGICCVERRGKAGFLILYDSPNGDRRPKKYTYVADWCRLPP